MTLKKLSLSKVSGYCIAWLNVIALLTLTVSAAAKPRVAGLELVRPINPNVFQANTAGIADDSKSDNLVQFCNNTAINIPGTGTAAGPGSPYPSTITVPAMTGIIADVTITLNNVMHTFASDIDVLLVGPTGASFVVMSDIGGSTGFDVSASVTISDSGATAFPTSGALSGTYRPTNALTEVFPAPAPAGPYNQPAAAGSATFGSVYGGTLADGDWRLYVADDANGDVGMIAGGWCIDIAPPNPGTLSYSSASIGTNEGVGMATVTVNRTGGTLGAVSVNYATTPGTATNGMVCTNGIDYVDSTGTLNWADADGIAKTFTVPICTDTLSESPAETVNLMLGMPTGGATIGTGMATLNIQDAASQFRNAMPIAVPDNAQTSSSITVSGAPSIPGKVRVTLFNVSHTFPDDLDVLLVAPDGSTFVILGDSGGGTAIVNQTLTFEDAATTIAPNGPTLLSGNYEPANWVTPVTNFAPPAPAGPYTEPGSALSSLGGPMMDTTFTGNPNGTWNLYVRDDAGGDIGAINGGFGLEFLVAPTAAAATVSGRVVSATGRSLKNIGVAISGGSLSTPRTAITNHFGYFVFNEIQSGDTYVISVGSKRYTFTNPVQVVNVDGNVTGIEFNAIEGF